MGEHGEGEQLDVVGQDEVATLEQRPGLGAVRGSRLRPARRHQAARPPRARPSPGHARSGQRRRRSGRGGRFSPASAPEAALSSFAPILAALPRNATWRFIGALAVALIVFYYGSTSEVAWLFLLAYWIVALVVAAYIYGLWNRRGLGARFSLAGTQPAPDSPLATLPEQLLRSGPIPAPIFEGDRA